LLGRQLLLAALHVCHRVMLPNIEPGIPVIDSLDSCS
jgi:hypothetical protein